jgi:PAS domain S-box-containing protein
MRFLRKISEHKVPEAALRESEERFRLLVDQVRDYAIFMLDPEGRVETWNVGAARIKGYTAEEIIGQHFSRFYTPEAVAAGHPRHELEIATREGRYEEEGWRVRKDGSRFIANVVITALYDTDDKLRGFAKVTRDITERKRLEQRLIERTTELEGANKELESFSYSVSHDLHAPLRAIDGFSRILLEDYADELDAEALRLLNVIRSNTQKMGQLIDDLLAFSRVGRTPIGRSKIDMGELVKSVFEELIAAASEQAPRLIIGTMPPAYGDRALIRQVFANLLSNAIKYSKPREAPVIEVGGHAEHGQDTYYVKDNGVGFDMQYANKLFCVFQRLHSAKEFEGTGVGLAIVQRIVQRHGGRAWAEAKVDGGAVFYFMLPTIQELAHI